MALSPTVIERLIKAIETDSLVVLCGAGLSIPSPSELLSAGRVAEICFDAWTPVVPLPAALRSDIEGLAAHFHAQKELPTVFINTLVPWSKLVGSPNTGHATLADLMISAGVRAVLSANFDCLIEAWAETHKVDMRGALDGQEAQKLAASARPLLKFHGCMRIDRDNTIWTVAQLPEEPITTRIQKTIEWLKLTLPDTDVLVVGYWSDWAYLNDALSVAFTTKGARSVTVIDASSSASLKNKAPMLWNALNSLSADFEHVQESSASALEDLWKAYSSVWIRRFYALAAPLMAHEGKAMPTSASPSGLTSEDLYRLRCDGEGVPYTQAAKLRKPPAGAAQAAFIASVLLSAGATGNGPWFTFGGKTIRIVNGAGRALADVKQDYSEPPIAVQADVIICAGAIDLGLPAKIVASGAGASTVRPGPGGSSHWLTLDEARQALHI